MTTDSPDVPTTSPPTARRTNGQFLRTIWRTHFYAALIAAPVLVVLSTTGLVILYTDTVNSVLHGNLVNVQPSASSTTLDEQRAAADAKAPAGTHVVLVNTPKTPDRSTVFQYTNDDTAYYDVYVDPYRARVLGVHENGKDLVGLANRLHGYLNVDSATVTLPALAHLWDPDSGPLMQEYQVGDLVMEIGAGWALVLALTGVYLWWPRRSEKGKALLKPRLAKRGRLRVRDIHAVAGILGITTLLIFVLSGLPWSGYWGSTWSVAANKITPPEPGIALFGGSAESTVARQGDLDRFGHRISWATRELEVPGSVQAPHQHAGGIEGRTGEAGETAVVKAGGPAIMSLDDIALAAKQENLKPGYAISMPTNVTEKGATTYGSFVLQNFWPMRIQDEKSVYLDQFSGKTLGRATGSQYGALAAVTETGVLTHMGTQFGIVNKIAMTFGALLILLSIATSVAMWWLRRPQGRLGLPRRPHTPVLPAVVLGVGATLAVIYPLWGITAVTALVVDRLLIQRIGRLRSTFNLADKPQGA